MSHVNDNLYLCSLSDLQAGPDTEQIAGMLRSLERWLAATESTARFRAARGRLGSVQSRHWEELASLGITGICVPSQFGGSDLPPPIGAFAAEALGRALSPEPYIACSYFPAMFLRELPETAPTNHLLQGIADGSRLPVMVTPDELMPRPAQTVKLGLVCAGGQLQLSGTRNFVYGSAWATDYIIVGAIDGESVALSLPASSERLRVEHVEMCDGSYAGELHFDGLEVQTDAIIASGSQCAAALAKATAWARIAASAELFGVQTALFGRTIDYLKTRRQFGVPLASFQALQHRCVDLYCRKEVSRFLIAEALNNAITEPYRLEELRSMASRCKARAASSAQAIARDSVQMHGAIGFSDENDVALYLNRTMLLSAWLGTADDHRKLLFKERGAQAA